MIPVLHPSVQDRVEELRGQFIQAQPFRHVVIDQFLDPVFCAQLAADFPPFDQKHAINERGEAGRKSVISGLARLSPAYARFDSLMQDPEFLALAGRITDIPALLYDPDYVGGGTHENLDGQELDFHVDFNYHPARPLHRRLNLIVFLNREWQQDWGGCLELLRDPWANGASPANSNDARQTVIPLENRAVIFETTESSWHGFRRITVPRPMELSRRSVAVYFYTKTRPADQTAPAHATIYYQRPLPAHIQAGQLLSEEDALEIQTLIARRDKQIQFLYERELEFSSLISGITNSPSFRIGRALTWPARALRSALKRD